MEYLTIYTSEVNRKGAYAKRPARGNRLRGEQRMTPTELERLIAGGEDSMLELKRDDVRNHDLARELVAFLNLEGGPCCWAWRTMAASLARRGNGWQMSQYFDFQ